MKNKLHILFICSWYPSRILPHNGDFIQRHAEAVATRHQVSVLHVVSDITLKVRLKIDDTQINGVRTLIGYFKPCKNPIVKFLRYYIAYLNLIKLVGNFDLVHLNRIFPAGLIALYLKKVKHKPFIISEHWHGFHKPFCEKIGFFEYIASKFITKKASCICPVTYNLAESMQDLGLKNNYIKVPNVVDTELFKPIKNTKKTYNIVHISSMDTIKNVSDILEVISKLDTLKIDFKFFLIGNNANDFVDLANSLKINPKNIQFINQLPQKDIVSYLQQADVLVLFSSIENSPCVILEAFACGVSVISTDVGGVSEHFPEDFGTLIPKDDKKALLEAIIKHQSTIKHSEKKEMHNYIVQNFSKKAITKQFTKVYLSALTT